MLIQLELYPTAQLGEEVVNTGKAEFTTLNRDVRKH